MKYLGLDLGRWQDPSALAVLDRPEPVAGHFDPSKMVDVRGGSARRVVLRHVERLELGTSYTDVVARVEAVLRNPRIAGDARLVVDATGVGMPVVEMLVAARLPCTLMPVVMTGGYGEHSDGRLWHVPKMDLLGGLQGMLERREVRFARGMRELGALQRELLQVQGRVRGSGKVRVGADGAGEHDDLVVALALACWAARKGWTGESGKRLYW
jgi:hypothetical protein